jgi:single-stranded-DNA-specific exonuclease
MEKRWFVKAKAELERSEKLMEEIKIDRVLTNLLLQRGIATYDQANSFFNPDLQQLHNPFEMKHMSEAVLCLNRALENNERILLFGDYDVDGTTAVAMMYLFLQKFS